MKADAETATGLYELRAPADAREQDAYSALCTGFGGRAAPEHPLVLVSAGAVLGALGLDPLSADLIEMRAAVVAPAHRRHGLGAVMTALAERAAAHAGFALAVVSAHPSAAMFYAQNGWRFEAAQPEAVRALLPASPVPGAVWMGKRLDLGVAQSPPTVFIRAAQKRERERAA